MYIIPGAELGYPATVIKTKKTEIWTNQMQVILFNECPRTIAKTMMTTVKLMTSLHCQFPDNWIPDS